MQCRDCPYGKDDFDNKMRRYYMTIQEYGIPNEFYDYLQPKDAADEFEHSVWCEKTGGKVWWYGHCSDCYEDDRFVDLRNSSKQKKRNKRERKQKHNEHIKRLNKVSRGYPSPVYYTNRIYIRELGYIENLKPYYRRLYRGKRSKYLKKQSHRKIRRYKGELHNGWQCHKLYDFWWKYF